MSQKQKTGLALGAGFSRGFAHIGVIKALTRQGFSIDYIAGSSMGSVIGLLYASGLPLSTIEELALNLKRKNWVDFTVPREGLVSGEKLESLLSLLTRRRYLEELPLPLSVTATDLQEGCRVVIRKGFAARAVRASSAIPGIFKPVKAGEKLLVDGGVLERVPVEEVRKMGADVVIAVDVSSGVEEYEVNNIFDIISRTIDIMSKELTLYRMQEADILITPYLKDISPSDFSRVEETIARGDEAACKAIPGLYSILKKEV